MPQIVRVVPRLRAVDGFAVGFVVLRVRRGDGGAAAAAISGARLALDVVRLGRSGDLGFRAGVMSLFLVGGRVEVMEGRRLGCEAFGLDPPGIAVERKMLRTAVFLGGTGTGTGFQAWYFQVSSPCWRYGPVNSRRRWSGKFLVGLIVRRAPVRLVDDNGVVRKAYMMRRLLMPSLSYGPLIRAVTHC